MTAFGASLFLVAAMACHPTPITDAEAKHLALRAAIARGVYTRDLPYLDAEADDRSPQSIDFRIFSSRYEPGIHSSLVAWFRIDLFSARLSDPILDGPPIDLPPVASEQRELVGRHCLTVPARSKRTIGGER